MYVVKGLFDFVSTPVQCTALALRKPTCVVAEDLKIHKAEEIEKTSQVYMTSERGFDNYCQNCGELAMVQETGSNFVPIRVFCKVVKCVK